MHRLQIVTFGSVAIVFAVIGVDQTIYDRQLPPSTPSRLAGSSSQWSTSYGSSISRPKRTPSRFTYSILIGTGGLSPPSRRRRTRTASMHNTASYGGGGGYAAAGIGSAGYDTKLNGSFAPGIGNNPLDNITAAVAEERQLCRGTCQPRTPTVSTRRRHQRPSGHPLALDEHPGQRRHRRRWRAPAAH
jgi:hypothetical protein